MKIPPPYNAETFTESHQISFNYFCFDDVIIHKNQVAYIEAQYAHKNSEYADERVDSLKFYNDKKKCMLTLQFEDDDSLSEAYDRLRYEIVESEDTSRNLYNLSVGMKNICDELGEIAGQLSLIG